MRLTFVLLLLSYFSFGQTINGLILDEKTEIPIAGVNVYLKKTKEGVITDEKGSFRIKSGIKKEDTIVFSHLGYKTKYIPLYKVNKKKTIVYLTLDVEILSKVSLQSNRKLKSKIEFKKLASFGNGLHSFGSLLIQDKIYIIGGDLSFEEDAYLKALQDDPSLTGPTTSFQEYLQEVRIRRSSSWKRYSKKMMIYDIASDTWKTSRHKFRQRAYHNLNYHNNKIYVIGGKRLSTNRRYEYLEDKIEVYDIKNDTILVDDTNPHQAADGVSFTYKDRILIMGGSIKIKNGKIKVYSNTMHFHNLKTGLWYELDHTMPKGKEVNGVLLNDKIYLIGGSNEKPLKEIETFDLTSGKWETVGDLFREIDQPAITYKDSIIYFFEEGKIYRYDTKTKVLNEYLINLFLRGSNLHYLNNKLYILGGFLQDQNSKIPSPRLFSIDLDEFKETKVNQSKKF